MKCPIDNSELNMTDRQGIEIDYCPQCRGVWLDRGELDKLIERSSESVPTPAPMQQEVPRSNDYDRPREQSRPRDEYYDDNRSHDGHKKRKKEGFLGDLFDF